MLFIVTFSALVLTPAGYVHGQSQRDAKRVCNHEWLFIGNGVSSWLSKNDSVHARCKTDIEQCVKCGLTQSYVLVGQWLDPEVAHKKHIVESLYHIYPNHHMYRQKCHSCNYSKNISLWCPGPPCPGIRSSSVDYNESRLQD